MKVDERTEGKGKGGTEEGVDKLEEEEEREKAKKLRK
jgi:hypothetical protein